MQNMDIETNASDTTHSMNVIHNMQRASTIYARRRKNEACFRQYLGGKCKFEPSK